MNAAVNPPATNLATEPSFSFADVANFDMPALALPRAVVTFAVASDMLILISLFAIV
jgi:hypothetical protein